MKRLLAALAALLLAPACLAIGPYVEGEPLPAGELPALMGRLEQRLRDDGFTVVGRHLPPGLPKHGSLVVTDPALTQAARRAGGSAILAAPIRIGVRSDGSVSYTNPGYWGRAYLRGGFDAAEPALQAVRARLAHALGERGAFGGDVPEAELSAYRYMIGMERIDSPRHELNGFASFDEALGTVRANLAQGLGGTSAVYEIVLPEAKLAVIGVAMNDPDSGEGWWAGRIGPDHVAALPYEIYIVDGKVYALYGRYRIALSWPALGMGQFMRIVRAPDLIHATLGRLAGAGTR
ncbi:MAG: hypothetical protein KIT35_19105 [Piscinibacter sp.]|uniref:hypothetical protein n=1 Tax=Piscinibacter sp. TaxID=1903157 RepID=UPI002582A687|nr:hypothetical protein [Piscinibacter sp.]MCW5665944.1 hypothetical protein [Piscinibacter sp.]